MVQNTLVFIKNSAFYIYIYISNKIRQHLTRWYTYVQQKNYLLFVFFVDWIQFLLFMSILYSSSFRLFSASFPFESKKNGTEKSKFVLCLDSRYNVCNLRFTRRRTFFPHFFVWSIYLKILYKIDTKTTYCW